MFDKKIGLESYKVNRKKTDIYVVIDKTMYNFVERWL